MKIMKIFLMIVTIEPLEDVYDNHPDENHQQTQLLREKKYFPKPFNFPLQRRILFLTFYLNLISPKFKTW